MYTILIDGDSIAYGAACISVDKESFELDMMLCQSQINAKMHEILTACNTRSYEIYVESRFNKCIFRNSIAVTKPYKGNRKAPLPEETYKLAVIDAVMDAKEHLTQAIHLKLPMEKVSKENLEDLKAIWIFTPAGPELNYLPPNEGEEKAV